MIITQRLHGDHLSFLKLLKEMEEAAESPGVIDVKRLRSAFSLLYPLMKIHEKAEETLLFPYLLGSSPEMRHQVEALDREHDEVHFKCESLFDILSAREPDPMEVSPVLERFGLLLRDHIRKEDEILFPAAEKVLDKDTLENLSRDLSELVHDLGPIQKPSYEEETV